ncbi:MAG TPA: GNAT family N-acetyltransferase [Solirubrobacteraceae bacterium]|jgi:predicted acetyltransferase
MPPIREAELAEFTERAVEALLIPPDGEFEDFLEACGLENLRVTRDRGGALLAGAGIIPTAQRAGGAWVPSALITAVWTAPAARGRGAAKALMTELLEELHAAGTPLSMLYPATLQLYRRVGYEVGGATHHLKVALQALPARRPEGWTVEELAGVSPEAPGLLGDLYDAAVPALGTLATRRVPALWHGMLRWNGGGRTAAFVARDPAGAARGSVVLDTKPSNPTVNVRELIALEPAAARTLLAHLAGYRGMRTTAAWTGGPFDPFAAHLPESPEAIKTSPAMVRLIDVAAALRGRGYPRGLAAEIPFDVIDPSLPANAGRLTLALDGTGAGDARPGGDGRVRADVRALAALYTGFATPRALALTGLLDGPPAELDLLAAAFAGPAPWLADRF